MCNASFAGVRLVMCCGNKYHPECLEAVGKRCCRSKAKPTIYTDVGAPVVKRIKVRGAGDALVVTTSPWAPTPGVTVVPDWAAAAEALRAPGGPARVFALNMPTRHCGQHQEPCDLMGHPVTYLRLAYSDA